MLKFAFDAKGSLISSDQAEHGVDYTCPCCGAVVRLRISHTGSPFYFCHHSKHHMRDCATLAENLNDYDPCDIDVKKIMVDMLHIMCSKGPGTPHGPGQHHPPKPTAGLTSMHQLWLAGIPYAEPDMPVRGGVLADFLIGPKAFKKYLISTNGLGERIIMAMPEKILSENRIRFLCPWLSADDDRLVDDGKRLTLHFADACTFEKICNYLFRESGTNAGKARYHYVLIAAVWDRVPIDACRSYCFKCRNGKKCQGMLSAECHSSGQIYIPRTPKNQK